jgi:hypothetical protein
MEIINGSIDKPRIGINVVEAAASWRRRSKYFVVRELCSRAWGTDNRNSVVCALEDIVLNGGLSRILFEEELFCRAPIRFVTDYSVVDDDQRA